MCWELVLVVSLGHLGGLVEVVDALTILDWLWL